MKSRPSLQHYEGARCGGHGTTVPVRRAAVCDGGACACSLLMLLQEPNALIRSKAVTDLQEDAGPGTLWGMTLANGSGPSPIFC
jgi:hypothetical protein